MEGNQNYKAIRDWHDDEKPRERLAKHGAATLSDSELVAILIGSGTTKKSAIDLAREILDSLGGISNLITCDYSRFIQFKGIGPAKAITLAAAFELNKRIVLNPSDSKKALKSPEDVAGYYISKFRGLMTEEFYVLLLNTSNQVYRETIISTGSLNASIVHPREVFKLAITESAASIILLHNHPSGNPNPSKEDIKITKQLVEAGKHIDIKVIDHLIIAGNTYYSFLGNGLL